MGIDSPKIDYKINVSNLICLANIGSQWAQFGAVFAREMTVLGLEYNEIFRTCKKTMPMKTILLIPEIHLDARYAYGE